MSHSPAQTDLAERLLSIVVRDRRAPRVDHRRPARRIRALCARVGRGARRALAPAAEPRHRGALRHSCACCAASRRCAGSRSPPTEPERPLVVGHDARRALCVARDLAAPAAVVGRRRRRWRWRWPPTARPSACWTRWCCGRIASPASIGCWSSTTTRARRRRSSIAINVTGRRFPRVARAVDDASSSWAMYQWWDANLSGVDIPEQVPGFFVSPGFFALLGVDAGHWAASSSRARAQPGQHHRVVLGHALWTRRFASRSATSSARACASTASRTKSSASRRPGFNTPDGAEVWAPLALTDRAMGRTAGPRLTASSAGSPTARPSNRRAPS